MNASHDDIKRRFHSAVNMTAGQISAWLTTRESKAVGFKRPGQRQSVGRQSARKIIKILRAGPQTEADYKHMRKVVG